MKNFQKSFFIVKYIKPYAINKKNSDEFTIHYTYQLFAFKLFLCFMLMVYAVKYL